MIARAFACDYDGTIADRGSVSGATAAALERVRRSGRKLLLVTGRRLADLETVCPGLDRMFDAVVAENGALLHVPGGGETRSLGPPPSPTLLAGLRRQRVPFDVGASIVATSVRFAEGAQAAVRESGEERALVFNRNDLMLLPPGVTKKTGLEIALATLGLSPHNAVGIGDAENDHAFLATCECAVAVADAIPALREHADYVTRAAASAGVVEFVDEHLLTDLAAVLPRLSRHGLRLGETPDGRPVMVGAHATTLLVAGSAAGGAPTLTGTLVGRLVDAERSVCLLAPAGHGRARAHLPGAVVLGGDVARPLPTSVQLDQLLREPGRCLVLDLSALTGREKPDYAAAVLTVIAATRAARGLPHWLVVDDAHHVFPLAGPGATTLRESLAGPLCVSAPSIGDLHRDVWPLVNALASTEHAAFAAAFAALQDARADRAPAGGRNPRPRNVFAARTSVADAAATAACGPPLSPGEALFASVDPGDLPPVRFTVDAR